MDKDIMNLDSQLAGTRLLPYTVEIPQRRTVNFAAGLADNNPCYFDDTVKALVAPPTFPVSVTWPVLSRLQDFIPENKFPMEVLLTQVHYTEHLILHRLIRPNDILTINADIASIAPHRAGTHVIIRLTALDGNDDPVFTEYVGAMLRGVTCTGEETRGALPLVPEFIPEAGPQWQADLPIDPLAPYVYDACADIEFPIHTSPKFARDVGLPGILLQGTATLGYAVRELVNREADENPASVSEIACTFTGMVRPGTKICLHCLGTRNQHNETLVFFEVLNDENKKAIRNGYMKIKSIA